MLEKGTPAPVFTTSDQNGKKISLSDFIGKKVILYFYPKDNTPGCTQEACNLRDNYEYMLSKGYVVLGVSPDSEASHKKFTEKQSLPQLKKLYGREYMGVVRTTYVIDEKGVIEEVITKVKTAAHAEQILDK